MQAPPSTLPPIDLREAARLDGEGKCAESEAIYRRALASASPPSLALLNNAGNHYLACGNLANAQEQFRAVLRINPSHGNANLQLARIAVEQKQPAQAAAFLRSLATQSDPALLAEAGALYARLGEFKLAQPLFQRVAAARPGDFDSLWNLGRVAARAGDLPRAREALDAALRIKPDDPRALTESGLAHAAGGDYPRAVFLLAQAEIKAPHQPGITLALARAAEDAGYYGDSAIAYDRYLRMQPADEPAQRDRARVLALTLDGKDEGLKALEQYVARRSNDPVGHFQLAQLCWEADPDKSLLHLGEAIKLDPRLTPAYTARAWLLHRLGRDKEALTDLETALRIAPNDPRALDLYGLVLTALDRPSDAEKAFSKAAALAPIDWEVRLHLGRALMEQGREQEARTWLDQYQKLRPARQRDARREPGMIALATLPAAERRAREIERFRSLARARPDDPVLKMHLAALLLSDGREDEAHQQYRALLASNADEKTLAQAGRTLLDARRFERAIPFLEKSGARLDHALALFQTSGPEAALRALDRLPPDDELRNTAEFLLLKAKLLDSVAGRNSGAAAEARQLIARAVAATDATRPAIAEQAASLLVKFGQPAEASRILARAIAAAPGNRGLLLSDAITAALDKRTTEAARRLTQIEERWPEWHATYIVRGLIPAQKSRSAAAFGARATPPPPGCKTLADWLEPSCRGDDNPQ